MARSSHDHTPRRVRRNIAVYLLVAAALLALLVGSATAGAVTITEFSSGITPSAGLRDITRDDQGALWFTETDASKVARITSSGQISEYPVRSGPTSIVAGPSGNIWMVAPALQYVLMGVTPNGSEIPLWDIDGCEQARQLIAGSGSIEVRAASRCVGYAASLESFEWSPSEHQLFSRVALPLNDQDGCYVNNGPFVASGLGGDFWVSCYDELGIGVGRITPGDPPSTAWVSQGLAGIPGPITVASDGSAWFTQSLDARSPESAFTAAIGRIGLDGKLTNFRAGLTGMGLHESGVHGITVGPDGNIWFTEPATDRVGRITPSGVITEFPLAPGAAPQGITVGNGRTLWFTEPGLNRVGRLDLNEAPAASIAVSGSPMTSTPLIFEGSSTDPDGSITQYRWDLGDGSSAGGPRVTHAFERPGTYAVTLTVTDNEGATAQARREVVIADPVVRVSGASASLKWNLKYAAGSVVITGSSERAARVAFALTRATKRFELGEASIPAGPFVVKLPAPRSLLPGSYALTGREVSGGGAVLRIDSARLQVPAPAQGIVDATSVIDARGRNVRAVRPLGSRRLSARFHFIVSPRAGARLEARWTVPHRAKAIVDPAPKRRRGSHVVSSIFAGAPLPQGLYACQLRAGGQQVATLRMRIG